MNNHPPIEQARKDLDNIRKELIALRLIKDNAMFLSKRTDVNESFYSKVFYRANEDTINGESLEIRILSMYSELK